MTISTLSSTKDVGEQVNPANYASIMVCFGANEKVIDKSGTTQLSHSDAFSKKSGTVRDLAIHIYKGHPWMPAILDRGQPRKKEYANYAELVALDFDSEVTIDEIKSHPFVKEFCCLGIESASSTPENNKFRLVFRYNIPVQDWQNIEIGQQYLMSLFPQADQSCKDASRFFFGAKGKDPFIKNWNVALPEDFMEEAINRKEAQETSISAEELKQARLTEEEYGFNADTNQAIETVREALKYIPGRGNAGSGRYPECLKIMVCLKAAFGEATAKELIEEWSPTDICNGWNVSKRLASLAATSKGSEVGFIVNRAKEYGFKPKSSKKTVGAVNSALEDLAKSDFKGFSDKVSKGLEQAKEEEKQEYKIEVLTVSLKHHSKFQVKQVIKSINFQANEETKLEDFLMSIASEISKGMREAKQIKELCSLSGHYIWLSLEEDKIFYDFANLIHTFGDRLKYNTFKKQVELDGEFFEVGTAKTQITIKHNFVARSKTEFPDIFLIAAKENSYSPLVDYLDSVHQKYGKSTEILEGMAKRYFGQDLEIYNQMLKKTLISAVARAYKPGCKVDTALILQGKQGFRKSTFFKVLAGGDEYFEDSFNGVGQKDEILKIHQAWFSEWAELETVFKRKEVAAVKAFLTSSTDNLRPPYGRDIIAMPRGGVICGTTNESEFLSDSTGNRRFWPIPVLQKIPTDLLEQERDQIWGAVVELYKQGEIWYLTDEEEEQVKELSQEFQSSDVWDNHVEQYMEENEFIQIPELLESIGIDIARQSKAEQMRVSNILKRKGCIQERRNRDGKRIRGWVSPNAKQNDDPLADCPF
ncbi:hypothetical protein H6F51_18165 [Cyanobacteria bacterium FACHB-DQ100]|nr:hypothetical protein [Cyanobacteria bacterium FACHB-DQ100]